MSRYDREEDASRAPLPINDYAIIGNSRSAALVGSNGSIDWLCLPRFDSPSLFAAVLDPQHGGRFQIRPRDVRRVHRRYVEESVVLETHFETASGEALLTDFVPVAAEPEKRHQLWPEYEIIRHIECTGGEVEIELMCDPRFDYARRVPKARAHGRCGWVFEAGRQSLIIRRRDCARRAHE
jgi:GH15 family glucan-1,4-alpha-glucosidase